MLSYALAIAVGLSSLILFSTAFLMSDIHRQDDFFWSGVGLFYALVLWFCATRITGGLLLGQTAAVALLISFNWQTLKLRKAIANPEKAAELNNFSVLAAINGLLTRSKSKPQPKMTETPVKTKVTDEKIAIPDIATTETKTASGVTTQDPAANVESPKPLTPSVAKKTGFFNRFFGGKKQQSISDKPSETTASITDTKLDDILDEVATDTESTSAKDTRSTEEAEATNDNSVPKEQPKESPTSPKVSTAEVTTPQPEVETTPPTTETPQPEETTEVATVEATEVETTPPTTETPQPEETTEVVTVEAAEVEITPPTTETPQPEETTEVVTPQSEAESSPSTEVSTIEVTEIEVTTTVSETEIKQPDKPAEIDTPQADSDQKTESETTDPTLEEKPGD